jgi:hypothetical protein
MSPLMRFLTILLGAPKWSNLAHHAVRDTTGTGNSTESFPAAEDVKKIERRLALEKKRSLKNPNVLDS